VGGGEVWSFDQMVSEALNDPEYLPVTVEGVYLPGPGAHVFGTYDGAAGWYVFQAFQFLKTDLPDVFGGVVLINRGFVLDENRSEDGTYSLPKGVTQERGLVRQFRAAGIFSPAPDLQAGSFYARDRDALIEYFFKNAPDRDQITTLYIDSSINADVENSPRGGTTRLEFNNRHLGYAITWYGLALGLMATYLFMIRKPKA
ncbi:MAG: SURF1 family protein, partial [Pseudomonadota bacterium]